MGNSREISPVDVGAPLPLDGQASTETYTYDYIIIGGTELLLLLDFRLTP